MNGASVRSLGETLNVWLTNCLPRRRLSRWMARYSRIDSPRLTRLSIMVWQYFVDDLRLDEAEQQTFRSLRDCFVRRLAPGARPIDPDQGVLVSPCDAVVGAFGSIGDGQLIQAKGQAYRIEDLLGEAELASDLAGGSFVTLRLKSSMYHRFHAPGRGRLIRARHLPGDRFNVNPPTLKRIARVFIRNERAVLSLDLDGLGPVLVLVPVAAILVGGIRLSAMDAPLGTVEVASNPIDLDQRFERGDELGWFEHGSTIIALARPPLALHPSLVAGQIIRVGQPLFSIVGKDACNRA